MLRVFGKTTNNDKIISEQEFYLEDITEDNFFNIISMICEKMNLATPIILDKHYKQFVQFNRVIFLQSEFLEEVDFRYFIVEIEKDEEKNKFFE